MSADLVYNCASCMKCIAKENKIPHPWLYGFVCPECLSACKRTITLWAAPGAFQCEFCTSVEELTIFQNRLFCSLCNTERNSQGMKRVRHDWKEKVLNLQNSIGMNPVEKRPLRVLSLFDGIGTGYFVLSKLGLEVEEYFSCEIDEAAIAVLNFRFHGRIKHLGSVSNLTAQKLKSLGRIDLLLGGSPCNQISLANPNRKGLYEPADTGVLFFDFYRVLKILESFKLNTGSNLFWLFENVDRMPLIYRDTISKTLQCKPTMCDAIEFLPAKRPRLFWGNIPHLHNRRYNPNPPVSLDSILEPYRKAIAPTLGTITTTWHSQLIGHEKQLPVIEDGVEDGLLITERERLFGFPTHFTDGPNLSIRQREILLGRAWSVPVIEALLLPLTNIYQMRIKGKDS